MKRACLFNKFTNMFRTQFNYEKASPTFVVCDALVEVLDFDTTIEPNNVKSTDNKGTYTNTDSPVSPFPQSAVNLNLSPSEVATFYKNVMQQETNVNSTNQNE